MKKIREAQAQLQWVQPTALKMTYELRAEEELFAALRFRSAAGSFATAEAVGGCWTFKRVGFLQARVTIRTCGSDAEIATFQNNTWSGGGTLVLADGRTFRLTTNLWRTQLDVQTGTGENLIHLQTTGFWKTSASFSMPPSATQMPELPWMAVFAWYIIVMIQMDASSV